MSMVRFLSVWGFALAIFWLFWLLRRAGGESLVLGDLQDSVVLLVFLIGSFSPVIVASVLWRHEHEEATAFWVIRILAFLYLTGGTFSLLIALAAGGESGGVMGSIGGALITFGYLSVSALIGGLVFLGIIFKVAVKLARREFF